MRVVAAFTFINAAVNAAVAAVMDAAADAVAEVGSLPLQVRSSADFRLLVTSFLVTLESAR